MIIGSIIVSYLDSFLFVSDAKIGRIFPFQQKIQLSRGFGVMIEEDGMAYRGTFLVNPEGKIKIAEIQDNNIGRNADELLRKVEAAQFVATHDGEVCPAKWKKGEATLKPSIDLVGKI